MALSFYWGEQHLFATWHLQCLFPQNVRFVYISGFSCHLYQNRPSLKVFFIGKSKKEACDNLIWVKWIQPKFNLSLNSVNHSLKAQFAVICSWQAPLSKHTWHQLSLGWSRVVESLSHLCCFPPHFLTTWTCCCRSVHPYAPKGCSRYTLK